MITLYDISSTLPNTPFSANTWKARLTLNYKGLAYKTEWVEYTDFASVYQKHDLPAPAKRPDGLPRYTLPVIYDDATGTAVADSLEIAKYLEGRYPESPRVLPPAGEDGVDGVKQAEEFGNLLLRQLVPFLPLLFKKSMDIQVGASREYASAARAKVLTQFGHNIKTIDELQISEVEEAEIWQKMKDLFDQFDEKFGGKGVVGWYRGDGVSFVDFILGGLLFAIRITWGEESEQWKALSQWNEEKWAKYLDNLGSYQTVH
ncbi:hypothetical protein CC1G_07900 [Coprinopsis cinerea okayama7|uniref:GST N-terminal domain-containing protein n=1 Tax=Coprinopsis cinerea (strain Okayama-7 / 130 / ATCC MYA-4618 / FGSC 9003) TaxID=240176 RepID=A8P6M2_COPC7|nr:hypothetical protein CC1G_07900 [Coprinopsis cinerea okayama7\|eukprot:XP_001839185.1 hypothetical protein CC1G_07900 [Coprinopsis cinerea okayama7\